MTTPDHRPYLTATDLRTPEDVLAWLIDYPSMDAAQASIALADRLDRERRQACRRAALAEWRRMMEIVRDGWDSSDGLGYWVPVPGGVVWASDHLTLALAFRAAAREP